MKVLQINFAYGRGSTGKIVKAIHKGLQSKGHESIVCYSRQRGHINKEDNVFKFCTELEGDVWHALHRYLGTLEFGGMWFATKKLLHIISSEKPDLVHLHCLNGYSVDIYKLLTFLGKNNIKTVITNHAEFMFTANCGHSFDCLKWTNNPGCGECLQHPKRGLFKRDTTAQSWKKMQKAYACFKTGNLAFVAVSPWAKNRLDLSPFTTNHKCSVVENGIDTDIFTYKGNYPTNDNNPIVFHVTAEFSTDINDPKGGYYVVELAKRLPHVTFKVACTSYIESSELPDNLKILGNIKDQNDLARLYSEADVTVIASRRETFSMIAAESMCCGTPIVGFLAGGPETISIKDFSTFVEYGDIEALKEATEKRIMEKENKNTISAVAKMRYSDSVMVDNYINIYNTLL